MKASEKRLRALKCWVFSGCASWVGRHRLLLILSVACKQGILRIRKVALFCSCEFICHYFAVENVLRSFKIESIPLHAHL
jgi:hypothetical protein